MLDQVICVILLTSVDPSNKYWQIVPQLDHRWCTNCLFYFFFVSTRINHKLRIFHTKEPNLKTLALRVPHGTRILQESENKDLQWILKSFALKHLYSTCILQPWFDYLCLSQEWSRICYQWTLTHKYAKDIKLPFSQMSPLPS